MQATLTGSGLAAEVGSRDLFRDLDVVVAPGDTVGLLGPNGSGKSTLLQTLAGLRSPAAGSVALSPPAATVGYLAQVRTAPPDETVLSFLEDRTGVRGAQQALDRATEALTQLRPGAEEAYGATLERWLALGGADLPERAEALAGRLGFDGGLDRPFAALSGGQNARVGLGSLLLSRYDILLLDEPTNDLDRDGLALLEEFVRSLRVGVMLVSHDREFLTRTVTSVLELDAGQGKTRFLRTDYATYLVERARQRTAEREQYQEFATKRDALQERARIQRAWLDKGMTSARKRPSDGDKLGRNARIEATEQQAAKARQTQRRIERLPEVPEPRKEWQLQFSIARGPRSGQVVAYAAGAVVRRGEFALGPVTLQIDWADRVGITGPNGAGKSTLLQLLLGRIRPTEGTAGLGSGVVVGEIDQTRTRLDDRLDLGVAFARAVPELNDADRRTLLAKFGLVTDQLFRPVPTLSPGERTRAALAVLQAQGVNLLVLDEPTNHLDLPAIEQLEQAVGAFGGTVLLVSHDRRLLDNVALTRRLHVDAGRVTETEP